MFEFIFSGLLGCLLIVICTFIMYEMMRLIWKLLPKMTTNPRRNVLLVITVAFVAHIINIWIFGIVYYVLHFYNTGTLTGSAIKAGHFDLDLFGCLYFSAVAYTTLGLGDITPEGALRMITGVESLTGFIMIGWTASFTYLTMEKFWPMPHWSSRKKKN